MRDQKAEKTAFARIQAVFSNLPPRTQDRLWQIILDHGVPPGAQKPKGIKARLGSELLMQRASIVHEKRRDGSRFWRLYLETGSGDDLRRERIHIGKEGGPELRQAVCILGEAYFAGIGEEFGIGPSRDNPEVLRKLTAALSDYMRHLDDEQIETWEHVVKRLCEGRPDSPLDSH